VSAARRIGWLVLVAVVAGLGVWLATRLWPTTVPGGLPEPAVDLDETFGASRVARAEEFEAFLRWIAIAAIAVEVAALAVWAWVGARWQRESAAGPIGTGFLLGMLGLGVVWIVQLPFSLLQLWWLRKHDVTEVGYVADVIATLSGLSGTFLMLCVVLAIAMGFAKLLRWSWWLPTAAVLLGVTAVFAFVQPYLLSATLKDASPSIQREADRLARTEGLDRDVPISVLDSEEFADQPNAFAFGFGASSHVVLFQALLDDFDDREVRATVAHEIGHVRHHHILKGLGWSIIAVLISGFVVAVATARRGGMAQPAAVPVALLTVTIVGLLLLPLESWTSQRLEAEADWAALEATRDPRGLEGVMKEFTRVSRVDPDPPGWWHAVFDSHPSMKERVQMARAWAELHR